MKKISKKSRNFILLGVGFVLAGSLAFAAQPIYQAINNTKKLAMPVRSEVEHEVHGDVIASYLDSNPVTTDVKILEGDKITIDYSTIFQTKSEPVTPPEQNPVDPHFIPPVEEEEAEETEEEEAEEAEETNVVVKNNNSIASTIIGIATLVFTAGLAALIVNVILKRNKKAKESN